MTTGRPPSILDSWDELTRAVRPPVVRRRTSYGMRAPLGALVAAAVVIAVLALLPRLAETPGSSSGPTASARSTTPSGQISCQPLGYTPAPIAFSFAPGRLDGAAAEETAVALFRACQRPTATISELTSSSVAATGTPSGPNAGQAVWRVQVDATVSEASPGGIYQSHFLIEVNEATGIPTVVGYG